MKYFVVSDVHSFFYEMMNAITDKGFEVNNPEHRLIVCGDLFDRGTQSVELLEFVKSLGDRFIYVRGNHEDLLFDCYKELLLGRGCGRHHVSNGTVETISQFTGLNYYELMFGTEERNKAFRYKLEPVLDFIEKKSVDYYEIGDYIFVHGYIPCYYNLDDFRNADKADWASARWSNGMEMWKNPKNRVDGKTIVVGHWHCSWGWSHIDQKYKEFPQPSHKHFSYSFQPWCKEGIIAIDACTAYTGKVNCIVIDG